MKTKFPSQLRQRVASTRECSLSAFFILRSIIRVSALLAFAVCSSPARADITSTYWTGRASNDWFNCNNWDPGCPDNFTMAFVNNGGKPEIQSSEARAYSVTLGLNSGDSGNLWVHGTNASLTVYQDCEDFDYGLMYVGYRDRGTLAITNGARVYCGRAYIAALSSDVATSNGAVTVDGPGSYWEISSCFSRLFVGGDGTDPGGTALLSVTTGGIVFAYSMSDLPVIMVGPSGTLTGNGTIYAVSESSSGRTVEVRGTLAPVVTLSIGLDGAISNLLLEYTAATVFNVAPQDANRSQLEITGTATLDGRLSVTMTGTFTPSTQFTLLHSQGALTGRFSSESITFPIGQNFTPKIIYDYTGNHVYLYLQPNT